MKTVQFSKQKPLPVYYVRKIICFIKGVFAVSPKTILRNPLIFHSTYCHFKHKIIINILINVIIQLCRQKFPIDKKKRISILSGRFGKLDYLLFKKINVYDALRLTYDIIILLPSNKLQHVQWMMFYYYRYFLVYVPGPILRPGKIPAGGVPTTGGRDGQKRDGGTVRTGSVAVHGGSGMRRCVELLHHVLQAHDPGVHVHGTVPQLD